MSNIVSASPADIYTVDEVISGSPALQVIVEAEPMVRDLLQEATQGAARDRWQRYETLKQAGKRHVGWSARQEALAEPRYYQAYVEAIDALLPSESEERA